MNMQLAFLSNKMKMIDFGMLSTRSEDGNFASRPMSNNGEVDYDGTSYFFTYEEARTVSDIERDHHVGLTFTNSGMKDQLPLFIAVEGAAWLIRDKTLFASHWRTDLNRWFKDGIDTPGLVMIRVHATRIHYWHGAEQGDITP